MNKLFIVFLSILLLPPELSAANILYSNNTANLTGYTIHSPSVRVCSEPVTVINPCSPLAPITNDVSGNTSKPNPFFGDDFGNFSFYVPTGSYRIEISGTVNIGGVSVQKTFGINNITISGVAVSLIASGTATLGTSPISSGACATPVTVSAPGVLTSDIVSIGFNGDPTGITGYGVNGTGAVLTIYAYPTANNVNFKVCNSTSGSITPGALTINWRVQR